MAPSVTLVLLLATAAVCVAQQPQQPRQEEDCSLCRPELCPQPQNCTAGVGKDRCDCCLTCAATEGQLCNLDTRFSSSSQLPKKYGTCGEDLECRLRPDTPPNDRRQAMCFCKYTETMCGSDGKTYRNLCQLSAANRLTQATPASSVEVAHRGPCDSQPWIRSPPEETVDAYTGDDVTLTCEVGGYPIPAMVWRVSGMDGQGITLPADLDHVAVQARGGPDKYQVTSWLQIRGLRPEDEGAYECVASNSLGEVTASARVFVLDKDKFIGKAQGRSFLGNSI